MNDEPKDISMGPLTEEMRKERVAPTMYVGEPRFMVTMTVADMRALFPEEFDEFVDCATGYYILKEPVRVVHRDGKLQLVAERPFYKY